jgi:hypothetical protein
MKNELLPCPFCGEQPEFESEGSHVEISCCINMEIQKWHYLTIEQRLTYNSDTHCYSDEAEEIAKNEIVSMWKTRYNEPTIKVDEELSYVSLPQHLKDNLELQQKVLDSQSDEEFLTNIREYYMLYGNDLMSYQQNWDLYEEPYRKDIVGDAGQFVLLGTNGEPQLLAEIVSMIDPDQFRFFVINGEWYGTYDNGTMTVDYTKKSTTGWEILSED